MNLMNADERYIWSLMNGDARLAAARGRWQWHGWSLSILQSSAWLCRMVERDHSDFLFFHRCAVRVVQCMGFKAR